MKRGLTLNTELEKLKSAQRDYLQAKQNEAERVKRAEREEQARIERERQEEQRRREEQELERRRILWRIETFLLVALLLTVVGFAIYANLDAVVNFLNEALNFIIGILLLIPILAGLVFGGLPGALGAFVFECLIVAFFQGGGG